LAEPVTHFSIVPDEVTLYQEDLTSPRFTPRELDTVRDQVGRSFTQVLIDETSDDKFTVLAWLKLRREGVTVDWEEMRDVVISVKADVSGLDPTNVVRPTTSPPSATTGE
jgi:hypothetical protein